ncbi:CRISPR-associated helicase, Cas3 family [Rubrobacter xylanophilus DSM 9941]|uniref:CRISPR-associated helicase, Cas3 family n=1 Tax=Rubrobacter xylanophilus (strain DSM 9941 / JCM 11954 / NBRC 16129 / PRD-1) TaxID=266117 RepID=Q1AZD4_RUBXD|nr:CRISPR-associated helicase/endonuclease Cas3 [Rubrobacter xylanophilus]ABG03244.1 CRISPR-associated helicase, Cas3 family [Rubrobacter xylanophilus DSM 9941]
MRFLARPGEPLRDHLAAVAGAAERGVLDAHVPDRERLATLARLCGLTHDFGKYTTYFQDRLPPKSLEPSPKAYGHHAFVSALLGAFVTRARHPEDGEAQLLVYLAIHRHHGNLVTPSEILPREKHLEDAPRFGELSAGLRREYAAAEAQLENLRGEHREQVVSEMEELGLPEAKEFIAQRRWWEALPELRSFYRRLLREGDPGATRRYWRLLLLFSALIDADKHVSAGVPAAEQGTRIEPALVEEHVRGLKRPAGTPTAPAARRLAEIRHEVREEAAGRTEDAPLRELYPAVLSLTAPTGSGKTLTALEVALRLRERVAEELGHRPRVIYALPFVNIIEQNAGVIEEVLRRRAHLAQNLPDHLLRSHHLAPLSEGDDENTEVEERLLPAEAWEQEIVVTTFVSLFESLVTNRNRPLKRLHNIAGSVVVLDEVQSIPYEQWRLVGHVLTTLVRDLGCTVIQMTATRPRILPEARELLSAPERHFRGLSRTRIIPRPEVKTLDDLASFVEERRSGGGSLLVVLNTISDSVELYRKLGERLGLRGYREYGRVPGPPEIFYLSTNITPWQRSRRVRLLKRCLGRGLRPLVVSTQVVEAGVDLDFDEVIRDQGPLDSIVQVAGRCNRGGASPEPAPVHVVFLEDGRGRARAETVYGRVLPLISREMLREEVEEPELHALVERYFAAVEERKSDDLSLAYLDALRELEFDRREDGSTTVSRYRHIQEELETRPVLVGIHGGAENAIAHLASLYSEKDTARGRLRAAFRRVAPFTITPTTNRLRKNLPPEHPEIPEHFYLSRAEVFSDDSTFYDMETGYRWEQEAMLL